MSYLKFEENPNPSRKTKRWTVRSAIGGDWLGAIYFHNTWRKYVFNSMNADFDIKCLQEIVQFLEDHKEDRNA